MAGACSQGSLLARNYLPSTEYWVLEVSHVIPRRTRANKIHPCRFPRRSFVLPFLLP